MRLLTFQKDGGPQKAGAFLDGNSRVVDLAAACDAAFGADPQLASVLAIIEGGDAALDKAYDAIKKAPASAIYRRGDVRLFAPIQPPPQIRDCLCFELHLKQAFAAGRKLHAMQAPDAAKALAEIEKNPPSVPPIFYQQPIYYKANRFAVIGTDQDVVWPSYSKFLDFELEFGVYIKKNAKNVPKEKAREYIFGYTIFNDMSARDTQVIEMEGRLGPGKGKDFDTGNPMGPCLVTADELTDPYNLAMTARVNGEEWGRGSSSSMHWKFEDLIAYISRSETLYPGEFLGSGTVGNGCGLEHLRFIKPGDVIELEVEGIGVLRNRVVKN